MILIADSGSTKTDWCVVEHGQLIQQIFTKGTNPFFQSEEEISNEIATALIPQLKTNKFEAVHFYGAGCAFPDKIETMRKAIASHLQVSGEIEVSTDMLAAARSLCGHQPGIACIMGTGSNSCYYDGKNIVTNVSPLGFFLGDEFAGLDRIHQQLQFRELKVPAAHKPTRGASLPALNIYSESRQGIQIVIDALPLRLDVILGQLGNQLLNRQRVIFVGLLHQNPAQIQQLQLLIGASGHGGRLLPAFRPMGRSLRGERETDPLRTRFPRSEDSSPQSPAFHCGRWGC